MSARREHRLRRLERRVEALEDAERERTERLERIQKANEMYWKERRSTCLDAVWTPASPKRSPWRRLLDLIKGRNNP